MYNQAKDGLSQATQEVERLSRELNDKTNIINNLTNMYNDAKDGLTKATQETDKIR